MENTYTPGVGPLSFRPQEGFIYISQCGNYTITPIQKGWLVTEISGQATQANSWEEAIRTAEKWAGKYIQPQIRTA